jgi:uncharacterized protein YecT (DUF1311 family)
MKPLLCVALMLLAQYAAAGAEVPVSGHCENLNSGSSVDITICGNRKLEKAEARLNDEYLKLHNALNRDPTRRKFLVEAQRSWLVYRDKSCKYWIDVEASRVPWCRAAITEARTAELEEMCSMEGCG